MPSHDELLCDVCGEEGYIVAFDDDDEWTDLRCRRGHIWTVRVDA